MKKNRTAATSRFVGFAAMIEAVRSDAALYPDAGQRQAVAVFGQPLRQKQVDAAHKASPALLIRTRQGCVVWLSSCLFAALRVEEAYDALVYVSLFEVGSTVACAGNRYALGANACIGQSVVELIGGNRGDERVFIAM